MATADTLSKFQHFECNLIWFIWLSTWLNKESGGITRKVQDRMFSSVATSWPRQGKKYEKSSIHIFEGEFLGSNAATSFVLLNIKTKIWYVSVMVSTKANMNISSFTLLIIEYYSGQVLINLIELGNLLPKCKSGLEKVVFPYFHFRHKKWDLQYTNVLLNLLFRLHCDTRYSFKSDQKKFDCADQSF